MSRQYQTQLTFTGNVLSVDYPTQYQAYLKARQAIFDAIQRDHGPEARAAIDRNSYGVPANKPKAKATRAVVEAPPVAPAIDMNLLASLVAAKVMAGAQLPVTLGDLAGIGNAAFVPPGVRSNGNGHAKPTTRKTGKAKRR